MNWIRDYALIVRFLEHLQANNLIVAIYSQNQDFQSIQMYQIFV